MRNVQFHASFLKTISLLETVGTVKILIMKGIKCFCPCLLLVSLMACGPSKSNMAETEEAAGEMQRTDSIEQVEEKTLSDTPLELADFAVECFRTNEREKLLPYATEECRQRMTEEMAIEEQMKNDRGIRKMRERLLSTTYTRSQENDMGSNRKLVRYTSNPSKYDMKVMLTLQDGKWLIEQVGPDR